MGPLMGKPLQKLIPLSRPLNAISPQRELRMKYEANPYLSAGLRFSRQHSLLRTWKYVWAQSWAWKYIWAHWSYNHEPLHRGPATTANMMISLCRVPRMMTWLIQKILILTPMAAILTLMAMFMKLMTILLTVILMKTVAKYLIPSFPGVAPSGSWWPGGRPAVRGERHQHRTRGQGQGRHQGKRQ